MALSTAQLKSICNVTGCQQLVDVTQMQSLWAGQGELTRLSLLDSSATEPSIRSLVVKQICFNASGKHPHGWDSQLAQQRKQRSYQVELNWYRYLASQQPGEPPRMPQLIYAESSTEELLLVLEDLAVDYPVRFTAGKADRPTPQQIRACIGWLAEFHARFVSHNGEALWPVGGYWHLQTRPDEWQAMPVSLLKRAAAPLDEQLNSCHYQTLLHGDAKLANFCFSAQGDQVAAVDFQYVGQGPGVKDLMLLLSSVMPDERLMEEAPALVDDYFQQLADGLQRWQPAIDADDLIAAWRPLYAVAWADFHRFLAGWRPSHWKIGRYCQQQTELALAQINAEAIKD